MKEKDRIPFAKMIEITQDLIAMKVKAVTFSGGGEPLLYPRLSEIIMMLSMSDIKIGVLTNGSRLTGKVADILKDYAVWVRVSIDGWDAESYAKYRGVNKDEFHKVINNMANYKGYWGASIIVDKDNASHIAELYSTLTNAGAKTIKVSPCIVSNDVNKNNEYHRKLKDIVDEQLSKINAVNHYHESHFDNNYTICPMSRLLTIIGADCKVYTCQDKAYTDQGMIGDISNMSFRKFWFSEHNQLSKINPSIHCQHHCVASNKNKMLREYIDINPNHMAFV